ncbi:MAG: hypothetical protein EH225_02320 [Calditrichaeota bacterium]|nr:hypothetical protein [Calditrichota bacterium]RQW07230.1 MAG: hypothetical protein EH225_02320 [Calditrichota bacterium]
MRLIWIYILAGFVFVQAGLAQEQPDQDNRQSQQESNVIDLTALGKTYTISARMELPQVRMFDRRITPDFKQLSAEKSFSAELSVQSGEIIYEPITSGKVKPVENMETLLKKKRF